MSEKQREQSTVDRLSAEVGQLRQQLDVLVSRSRSSSCCCGDEVGWSEFK